MIDENPTRISLPWLLLYLLTAAILIVLSGGAVILLKGWLFGASPPPVEGQPFPLDVWGAYAALAVSVLIAYLLQARLVERRPRRELASGRAGELPMGAIAGIGLSLLVVLGLWLGGAYRVAAVRGPAGLLAPTLMAIGAGLSEELLLRGFVLGLIERWAGSVVALALTAMLFGGLHFANSGAGIWPVVALMIGPGFALGAAYLATGRLWLPIGLHFGWNFGQSGLFGLLDSGTSFPSVIDASVSGPYWLTGGAFGPEASLPGLAVWLLLGAFLLTRARRRGRLVPFHPSTDLVPSC
jgi:membrane protease YdiL (CAAX protease family)